MLTDRAVGYCRKCFSRICLPGDRPEDPEIGCTQSNRGLACRNARMFRSSYEWFVNRKHLVGTIRALMAPNFSENLSRYSLGMVHGFSSTLLPNSS